MNWSASDVSAQAERDFEGTWMNTLNFVPSGGFVSSKKGRAQPEAELIQKLRQTFLSQGYSELFLPVFISEGDLAQQLGPEAKLAAVDRFVLSSYSRPGCPQSDALSKIKMIAPTFNEERLEKFRDLIESYSRGDFNSDRLLSLMVERTGVRMDQATEIMNLFSGDKELKQTGLLLRRGLAASWLETLAVMMRKEPLPLQLFCVGPSFSWGDKGMRASFFASGAVMSDSVSPEDGKLITKNLLEVMGVQPVFMKTAASSKMFIPGTEHSILVNGELLGRLGLVSPIALSNFGIESPTLVFEFNVDRLAVLIGLADNEKAAHYPQFFGEWKMTDEEIGKLIRVGVSPSSWGKEIATKIIKVARLYPQQPAPCEFKLLEKEVDDHIVEVWLVSNEGMLCGKDYDDEIFVFNGNVISSPPMASTPLAKEAVSKGVKVGVTFLEAFADYAGALIEQSPTTKQEFKFKSVSDASEINLLVPELVRSYVKSKRGTLSVAGDVGLTVETRVKRLWKHEQPQ